MKKILEDIAKVLDFGDSFFEEAAGLGKVVFFEADLGSGQFKASANYKRLFGVREDTCNKIDKHLEIIHPDDLAGLVESFHSSLQQGKDIRSEYRVIIGGEVRYFSEKSVIILDGDKKPVKIVGMKQDVTDEKVAEIKRKEYIKKLEQAHKTVATIVHDLKGPIHNISMVAELLKGNVAKGKETLVEVLEESCQHSYAIIEDVLESSLAEEVSSEKEYCNMHTLVYQSVKTFAYAAQKKQIEVILELQPDIFAFVYPQKLQRAIENLLSNAVKFSYRKSKIEVGLFVAADKMVIKIADFGIGMDEGQKAKLFHKDRPAKRRGTSGEKSFGLGLPIVQDIVQQHGGAVRVESGEKAGTRFYLELPVERTA